MTEHIHEEHIESAFCEKHPDRETTLRCNRCNRWMCAKCAVRTPTGYRCEDCVRGQQKVFDTAQTQDYVIAPVVAGVLSLIAGAILSNLWIYFLIFGAPFAGRLIAEVVRRVISRRRSKNLFRVVTAAVFIGGLLPALFPMAAFMMTLFLSGQGLFTALINTFATVGFGFIWNLVYALLAGAGTYYSLSGLRI